MKTLGTLLILLALGIFFYYVAVVGLTEHGQRTSRILWDHHMAVLSIANATQAANHELSEDDKRKRRYGISTPIDYSKLPLREPTQSELDSLAKARVRAEQQKRADLKRLDEEYSALDAFTKNKTAVTSSLVFFFVGAILLAAGFELKKLRPTT